MNLYIVVLLLPATCILRSIPSAAATTLLLTFFLYGCIIISYRHAITLRYPYVL